MRNIRFVFIFFLATLISIGCAQRKPEKPAPLPSNEVLILIRENPNLVLEVLKENNYAMLEMLLKQKRLNDEIKNPFNPLIQTDRIVFGKADAPITIVGYSDFTCPFCKKGSQTILTLMNRYPDDIRFIFKHTPANKLSWELSVYYEAIARQSMEKAGQYYLQVFDKQKELIEYREGTVESIIESIAADKQEFTRDIKDKEISERLRSDMKEFANFRFNNVPMFLVNGISVHGAEPIEEFEKIIKLVRDTQNQ